MKQTRLPVILAALSAVLALSACSGDTTRTPMIAAATPSLAPPITPTRQAHHVIELGGDDSFPRLSWSPDSRYLAVGNRDRFTVWDGDSDPPSLVIEKPEFPAIFRSEISPNGRLISLVQCSRASNVACDLLVWDWAADQVVDQWIVGSENDMAWSPEGDMLAVWVGSRDRITFWADPTSGEEAPAVIRMPPALSGNLVWLPNGTLRMLTFSGESAGIWNSSSSTVIHPYPDFGGFVSHEEALSADGLRAVSTNSSGEIVVWDASDGTRLQTIAFPRHSADYLSLNADGSLVAAASYDDTTISVFDVATSGLIATLPNESGSPFMIDLAFSPDSQTLASSYENGEVHLWDLPTMQTPPATVTPIPTYTPHPTLAASPQSVSFAAPFPEPGENAIHIYGAEWLESQALRIRHVEYSADFESFTIRMMDVDIASQSRLTIRDATLAETVELSPDGRLYTQFDRNAIVETTHTAVIDLQSGETLFLIPFDPDNQEYLHWSRDQRTIYIEKESVIEVYDGRDGAYIGDLPNPESEDGVLYSSFILSPDGKWAASTNEYPGAAVVIWNLETLQIAYQVPHLDQREFGHLIRVMWSHDSSRLVMVSWKGVQVLNLANWQIERTLKPEINGDPIAFESGFVYWSPDGDWLIHRGYINLTGGHPVMYAWHIDTGEQRLLMQFPDDWVGQDWRFAWHPQRALFATTDTNGRVYLVSMEGAVLTLDSPFEYQPAWMDWSPDGRSLAALGENGLIQVWTFDSPP